MRINWKRYTIGTLLFATSLLFNGCGGGGAASQPAPSTSIISGNTSLNGAGLAGVTVTITGAGTGSVTTDASGNYKISGLLNGDYTITPAIAGYTFTPLSQAVTISNGNVTVPAFTATAISSSFNVTGKVSLGGAGLSGATVTITGAGSGSATTDASGNYTFTGVRNGNCTITPTIAGYTFTPLSQAITVADGNVTVPEFTAAATPSSFTVSGKVSLNGTGLYGVTVTITGTGTGSLTTDASGNYTFIGVRNGDYTITPALTGYTFTPANRAFSVNNGNITGQDFPAAPANTGTITITF